MTDDVKRLLAAYGIPDEYYRRELPDGRYVDVVPLTFGRARINLGRGQIYESGW